MLSAVIPTRDRPDLLQDCLETLVVQDVPAGALEVIVVDDGSLPSLAPVVDRFADAPVAVRYVAQAPSGLNPARNRGAAEARGDLLAYLDDDTLVARGWAAAMLDAFERVGCDGVAGRVELRLEGDAPGWLTPRLRLYLSELELGSDPVWLEGRQQPVGANCAVTRSAFDRVGGFRAGLDRIGTSLVSNGDVDFFRRVRGAGGRVVYWPAAHVLHRVPPSRLATDFFQRRAYAQGVSDGLLVPTDRTAVRVGRVGREVIRAGRAIPILMKNLTAGRGTTSARVWLDYCRGRVAAATGKGS